MSLHCGDTKQGACLAPRISHEVGEKVNSVRVFLWKVVTIIAVLF